MRTWNNYGARLRRLLMLLVVTGLVANLPACEAVIGDDTGTEQPERSGNPKDPKGNDAQPPEAVLTSHTAGQTVALSESGINISWEAGGNGITDGVEYQYRLNRPGQGEANWSDWGVDTQVAYRYLNETLANGTYTFQVLARASAQTSLTQASPTELSFTVDAISNRGLIFNPRTFEANGDLLTTEIWLHNIQSTDQLAGVKGVISFNTNAYQFESLTIPEDGSSKLKDSGGEIVSFQSVSGGTIEFNIGVLGGDLSQISGSGPIAILSFRAAAGGSSTVSLQNSSKFKSVDGQDLSFSGYDEARISN